MIPLIGELFMNDLKNKKLLYNLVDTQPSLGVKRHGGGMYGERVLTRIIESGRNVVAMYDSALWLNPEIKELCERFGVNLIDVTGRSIQSVIDEVLPDVYYSPQPTGTQYGLKGCGLVFTVHDMRDLELPLDRYFWKYKPDVRSQLKNVLRLIFPGRIFKRRYNKIRPFVTNENIRFSVVSNHSRSAVKLFFPELKEKDIPVMFSPSTVKEGHFIKKYDCDYFLLVSGVRWEKNNLRAIIALDELCSEGYIDGKRVIVTGADSKTAFKYKFKNPEIFSFVGYVDDDELRQLYHDAYCFIYPSLNEGFGYPPLEAMYYGVPVLASPFSSISEVCGDAALYFNPFSIKEIKMRIIQLESPEVRSELGKRGLKRYGVIRERQDCDLDRIVDFIYS